MTKRSQGDSQQEMCKLPIRSGTENENMAKFSAGTMLLGIFAVLFGLLGAYVVRKELNKPQPVAEPTAAEPPAKVLVPMAGTDLQAGRKLTMGDIAVMRMSPQELRERGISGPFMNSTQQIIGRILKSDLAKGETFNLGLFYPQGTGPNVVDKLEPGYRAVTINVKGAAAVAGFASPGSMVDVIFRADADEDRDLPETTVTLIEGVRVLAFNEITYDAARYESQNLKEQREASVTLSVQPHHATALRVVEGRGALSLALRSPEEAVALVRNHPQTLDELLNRRSNKHRMEVYRGRSMERVEFRGYDRISPTSVAPVQQQAPVTVAADTHGPHQE